MKKFNKRLVSSLVALGFLFYVCDIGDGCRDDSNEP